jgi:hypothetical protein
VDGKSQGPVKYQIHLYKSQNDDIPKEKIAEHTREEDGYPLKAGHPTLSTT